MPDDVIAAAERRVEVIRSHEKQTGESLPYGPNAIEQLESSIDVAKTEWNPGTLVAR